MILKKPYAFLIKYFRIIHLALALPIIYFIIKTSQIVGFFSDYVRSNYSSSITNIASTYVNYFMYLSLLIILGAGIAIYFLMRKKEKSTKFYFALIVFYLVLFVVLGFTHSILSGMERDVMEATTARAYRDISYIFYLPQYFFVAFTLFRGIGFDIKKFNFELDIQELEITDIDSEEFELNLGIDDYKIKRNIRRFIREFKYYVKENRFIFTVLCSIVIIILGTLIYLNRGVYNRTYKQSQTVIHNNLNIQVQKSMITNRDYSGNLFKDNKHYVVIQLFIENRGKDSKTLDYNNFFLELKTHRVYPILDRASYFLDFGLPLKQDTELKPNSKNTYVMTYEISPNELENKYILKILEQVIYNIGEINPTYKKIELKPLNTLLIEDMGITKPGKITTFEQSFLQYSSLQIKNYEFKNSLTYQYQHCYTATNCRMLTDKVSATENDKILMILDSNLILDKETFYYKSVRTERLFPNHFISLKYKNGTESKIVKVENVTPTHYTTGMVLKVPKILQNVNEIEMLVTLRNKQYRID